MAPAMQDEVLAVGDRGYTWDDIRSAPELKNWWAAQSAAAAARVATSADAEIADEDVHAAGVAFRRDRRLLAADDLREWLTMWGLSVDGWKQTLAALLDEPSTSPPARAATDEELWAFVAVSGSIAKALQIFAANRAAAEGNTDLAGVVANATQEHAILAELDRRRLEWTTLDLMTVELPHEDAALEALMVLNHDGDSLSEMTDRARAEINDVSVMVEELLPGQQGDVLSSPLGSALGPYEADATWDVVIVNERHIPDLHNSDARERAVAVLTERAMDQLLEEHVSWTGEWL